MITIAELFKKYDGELTSESGVEMDNVEVGDIVETIACESDADTAVATFETAMVTMGEVAKNWGVLANIEEQVAFAKENEMTAESAMGLTKYIADELATVGLTSELLGFDTAVFTAESANGFPVATINSIVGTIEAETVTVEGAEDNTEKTKMEKFKALLANIWKMAVAAWNKVKTVILAMFGNNEAVATKLLKAIDGYSDEVIKDTKLTAADFAEKFTFLETFDKTELMDVIENLRAPALSLGDIYADFKKGAEAGNLGDFLALSKGLKVTGKLSKYIPEEFKDGSVVPLRITGKTVTFLGSTDKDSAKEVSIKESTVKVSTAAAMVKPMTNADIKSVLEKALALAKSQKLFIKTMENTVNAIKDIKAKTPEFAANAKISKYVGVLTSANSQYVSNTGTATKYVIQICGKQLSTKVKKVTAKPEEK